MGSKWPDAATRVRFGGQSTPKGFLFELDGGALCLDFVNTREPGPGAHPQELVATYGDLLSWGTQSGSITPAEARALERLAAKKPREAAAALERARTIREDLYQVFSARAAGSELPVKAVVALGEPIASALGMRRLRVEGGRAAWTWGDDPSLDRVLWPALASAGHLLTSGELDRLRECASEECAWLFLDGSKNGSRRWCDMTVCGNRDKVRRHRERRREG